MKEWITDEIVTAGMYIVETVERGRLETISHSELVISIKKDHVLLSSKNQTDSLTTLD